MSYTLVCTGGIGSGKSYVSRVFNKLGVPLYNADDRAKLLYNTDKELVESITEVLGEGIIHNGVLDRKKMASLIFGDDNLLHEINRLVHPRVLNDFLSWKKKEEINSPVLMLESAIYFETPLFEKIADGVIIVFAPEELRIQRVMQRDGVDEKSVRLRMFHQCSFEKVREKADFIIFADGKKPVLPQVVDILTHYNFFEEKVV